MAEGSFLASKSERQEVKLEGSEWVALFLSGQE